jgi:transcriptional regulator with XRE-family HTH domain
MVPGTRGFDAAADLVLDTLEAKGMSVRQLAAESGVKREALAYWVGGKRPLRADYLLATFTTLGLEIRQVRR